MAEDEIIKKHTKAVYDAWVDKEKDWKHKAKDILLEVGIIVFAVTISIWLHNWSEDMKDTKAEKTFLTGLRGDIQSDLVEMKGDRASLKKALNGIHYFQKVGAGQSVSNDSLNKYIWIFFSETQINPQISRFEALKSSGKLDIIDDKKLQYDIIDLYQKIFPQIFRLNQSMNALIKDKFASYLADNMELNQNGSPANVESAFRKSKMRILLMQGNGFNNSINGYSQGIDKANEIINQIDKELK